MMILDRLKALPPATIEKWLFGLVIVFLPTQLGKHFWPDWSYVFSLKIDYLAVTIYFWDILVFFLWVFYLNRARINWTAVVLLVLFFTTSAFSMFFSSNWQVGLSRLINWLPAGLFGVYIASIPGLEVKAILKRWLPVSVVISALIAFLQIIFGRDIGLWILGERDFSLSTTSIATFNWYGQIFLRPYATFPHPNVFAAFMLLCGFVLLFLSGIKHNIQKVFHLLIAAAVFFSFSRASIAIYTVLVLFLLRKQFLVLVLLFLFLSPVLFVRFDSAFNFDQLSLIRREELAETAMIIFMQNPFLGVGLNNFIPEAMSSVFLSGTNRFLQPVHNIFLLVLAESGLVGLVGFLIFLLYPVVYYKVSDLLNRSQVVGLLLIVVFLGAIDHYFLTLPQGQRIFFLIWGMSLSRQLVKH
jgi:O-antigen ligase